MTHIQKIIITLINDNPGINNINLIIETMKTIYNTTTDKTMGTSEYFLKNLEELVNSKEVVEVEYILPTMDYRIKSIFFPKGTTINLKA